MALLVLGRVWGRWGSTEDGLGLRGGKGGLRGDGEEEGQVERLRERLADDEPSGSAIPFRFSLDTLTMGG